MPDDPAPAPAPGGGGPVSDLIERTRELIRRTQDVLDSSRRQLDRFRRGGGPADASGEKDENRSA
ncbi:MAG TPA: hypothetical protein VFQ45_13715 [Longimicrobium sp.]|nr:hypothetical protein [Longimicrobium sp.]